MYGFDDETQNSYSNALRAVTVYDHLNDDRDQLSILDNVSIALHASLYGIANNFTNLGKWAGVVDDETELIDLEREIGNLGAGFGEAYAANSGLYDLAGDLVTSFVPGGLAIKGLSLASKLGNASRVGKVLQPFTRRTQVLEQAIKREVDSMGRVADIAAQKRQLTLFKTMEQAYEGAVTGLAVELTLNAGDVLNDEGLTTASKIASLGLGVGFGSAAQGILGGTFSSLAARGRIKRYQDATFTRDEAPFIYDGVRKSGANVDVNTGAEILESLKRLQDTPATSPLSKRVKDANLLKARTDFRAVVNKTFDLTGMKKSRQQAFVDDLLEDLKTPAGIERAAAKLQGGKRVRPLNTRDFQQQDFTFETYGHRAVPNSTDVQTVDGFLVETIDKFKVKGLGAQAPQLAKGVSSEFNTITKLAERELDITGDNTSIAEALRSSVQVREDLGVDRFTKEFPKVASRLNKLSEGELAYLKRDTNVLYYDSITGDVLDTIPTHLADQPKFKHSKGKISYQQIQEGKKVNRSHTLKDFENRTVDSEFTLLEIQALRLLVAPLTSKSYKGRSPLIKSLIDDSETVNNANGDIVGQAPARGESTKVLEALKAKLQSDTLYGHSAADIEFTTGTAIQNVEDFAEPRSFAMEYTAPRVDALTNTGVLSALASEKATAVAAQRAAAETVLGDSFKHIPTSIGLNRVEGYDMKRMYTNATQVGDYGSIEAWASHINEVVTTRVRNTMEQVVLPKINAASDIVLGSPTGKAHLSGYLEWHSTQPSGTVQAGDFILSAKTHKAFREAKDLNPNLDLENYLEDLSGGADYWHLSDPDARFYINELNTLIKRHVTEPEDVLRGSLGESLRYNADEVYLPPRDYPHMTFIRTETKNPLAEGTSKTYRVTADTAAELQTRVNDAMRSLQDFNPVAISRKDAGQYAAAQLEYDFNGANIQGARARSGLKKSGQFASFSPEADADKLIAEHARWFQNRLKGLNAKAVSTALSDDFAKLARLADEDHARFATDNEAASGVQVINGTGAAVKRRVSDYQQVMALAQGLDIGSHNFWKTFNNSVENWGAKAIGVVNTAFFKARTEKKFSEAWTKEAEAVQAELAKQGINMNAGNYVEARLANKLSVKPTDLRGWAGAVNAFQATLMFRMDTADAAVNVLGATVKLGGELKYLQGLVQRATPAQQEAYLRESEALFGAGQREGALSMWSSGKAFGQGFREFFSPEGKALVQQYVEQGLMSPNKRQLRDAFEEVRIDDTEFSLRDNTKALEKFKQRAGKVIDLLSTPSDASNLAVQFSVIRVADRLGRALDMDDAAREHLMHMMNRRVNAITNPTQKPRLFQGALGISMSLYQSYTFHMMNNLFRYADKGSKAAPIAVAALNSAFFGAQSVPGFQQLNMLIGHHNEGNVDIFGASSKVLNADPESRDVHDFLIYGAGSALLQGNLFVRGDLNPRTPTLVPTNVLDIPTVSNAMRVMGAVGEGFARARNGENYAFAATDALVNVGLNRPLRGIWAAATGATRDKGGQPVAYHEDLWSYGTAVRSLGFKPLNESIMQQFQSRTYQYKAQDTEARKRLGKTILNVYEKGQDFDEDQLRIWQRTYTSNGGNASGFADFMERTMLKSEKDLSLRLEKMVGKNPEAISQYQTLLGF